MSDRADPFNLGDFQATPKAKPDPVVAAAVDKVASENGFPSRQAQKAPPQRPAAPAAVAPAPPPARSQKYYTTGRNVQRNIKATQETWDLFDRIHDEIAKRDQRRSVPSGELLEKAIHALAKSLGVKVANG